MPLLLAGWLLLGLFIALALLMVARPRRVSLLALLAEYVLMGLLLSGVIPAPLALAKVAVGGMVFFILYPVARRPSPGARVAQEDRGGLMASFAFRLTAFLLAGAGAYGLFSRYPLAEIPGPLALASYLLMAVGLLMAILGEGTFESGLGLLTFQMGFESVFTLLEGGLLVAGLLGLLNILLALAISYLSAVERTRAPARER